MVVDRPAWTGQYVTAVTRLAFAETARHAVPRPDPALDVRGWRQSMCDERVFPLTFHGCTTLEFWPDGNACRACITAIEKTESEKAEAAEPT